MRYEAGDCAIVTCVKGLSIDLLKQIFDVGHIFAKNRTQPKAIIHGFHDFWSNSTYSKNDIIGKLCSC